MAKRFPESFFLGAATSAYQVEGGNLHSDWWAWEKAAAKESSGDACRHYELYEEDFDLAKNLHHNAHRFSVEWARVEPEEGKFSDEAVKHYQNVVRSLQDRGIEPVVTLHHFTNPQWFSKNGGWESKTAVRHFLRYCEYVVRMLSPDVRYWITINEPTIYNSHAYLFGVWPPQVRSLPRMLMVGDKLLDAHVQVYRMIHRIYHESSFPVPRVSIAHHAIALVPCRENLKCRFAAWLRHKIFNEWYLERLYRHGALDFIGINYYSRQLVEPCGWNLKSLLADNCKQGHHPVEKNSLGWDIYPEGLGDVLIKFRKYKLPILITENGICTDDDAQRWEYIRAHLLEIYRAIESGVEVFGYLYWALMDNFEWDKGFSPRFGLVGMDYGKFCRTVRPSALKYAEVCRTGVLQ